MLENRTGWRGQNYPNREVERLICHVTLYGPYKRGGEPLPVWGSNEQMTVGAVQVSPSIVAGHHIAWDGHPTDPRIILLTPSLEEASDGTELGTYDVTVEAVMEVG
jgi:hypothetical protein